MPIAQACFVLDRVRMAGPSYAGALSGSMRLATQGAADPDVPCASRHVEAALSGGLHVMRRVYRLYAAVRRECMLRV